MKYALHVPWQQQHDKHRHCLCLGGVRVLHDSVCSSGGAKKNPCMIDKQLEGQTYKYNLKFV